MSTTGLDLMGGGEMRSIVSAYPKATEFWSMQGAHLINSMVMTEGIDAACKTAWKNTMDAHATLSASTPTAQKSSCDKLWDLPI